MSFTFGHKTPDRLTILRNAVVRFRRKGRCTDPDDENSTGRHLNVRCNYYVVTHTHKPCVKNHNPPKIFSYKIKIKHFLLHSKNRTSYNSVHISESLC